MKRNSSLRLRMGDSTAGVRMDAMNEENMKNYFELLKKTLDDHVLTSTLNLSITWMKQVCLFVLLHLE